MKKSLIFSVLLVILGIYLLDCTQKGSGRKYPEEIGGYSKYKVHSMPKCPSGMKSRDEIVYSGYQCTANVSVIIHETEQASRMHFEQSKGSGYKEHYMGGLEGMYKSRTSDNTYSVSFGWRAGKTTIIINIFKQKDYGVEEQSEEELQLFIDSFKK